MVEDIRVVGVVQDRAVKGIERGAGLTHLHVHAGDLDPGLSEVGEQINRLLEVLLRAGCIA